MIESDWQERCHAHIGRTETAVDELSPYFANGLMATQNEAPDLGIGDALPPLFHWLYFNKPVLSHQLKDDGHATLGGFLPPVLYPHRMWAGSSITFHDPLLLGEPATRISTIKSIDFKSGSSGPLCFVKVEHAHSQSDTLCLTDVQTIVYRESTGISTLQSSPVDATPADDSASRELDSIALFRYSALTFNSHRIHYDLDYCRNVEGYPDLVVHGPLMATLMMKHMLENRHKRLPANFDFRGSAPVFAGQGFRIESETVSEHTTASLVKLDGTKAMQASVDWKS